MKRLRTEALVLRTLDFGESDRIVHLLTRNGGRMVAIAKGAKRSVKRFPGALDLFNFLRIEAVQPRNASMARLEGATLLSSFGALRCDTRRYAMGCYLLELFNRLAPEGGAWADSRALFDFAREALGWVELRQPDPRMRVLLELRTLDALGLCPELRNCVRCGSPLKADTPVVQFQVAEGGPHCGACSAKNDAGLSVHLGTLRTLEQSLRLDLPRLDRLGLSGRSLDQAAVLVSRFERFHVGLELRSAAFLHRVLHPDVSTAA